MEDAKEHLEYIRGLNRKIKKELLDFYELQEKAKGVSSYMGGNEKVQTSLNVDKIADMAIKLLEKKNGIRNLVSEYKRQEKQAMKNLSFLKKEKEKDVLRLVYIKDFSFAQYAEYRGMCFSGVWRLHKRALQNITEIYEKNQQNA